MLKPKLPPHALDIFELAQLGYSDSEIGDMLDLSRSTVLRWRHRLRVASRWTPPALDHGTPGRYKQGCRCNVCTESQNARSRDWFARAQADTRNAPRYGEPWTAHEDDVVLALGPRRAASQLARTYAACVNRLRALRRLTNN